MVYSIQMRLGTSISHSGLGWPQDQRERRSVQQHLGGTAVQA